MTYVIEHLPKKYFIGTVVKTTNEKGRCITDITELKEKFFRANLEKLIPNQINQNLLAVYSNYEGDYTKPYKFYFGKEVSSLSDIPKGMKGIEIAPSSYAVFTATGDFPQSIGNAWYAIWNEGLKRSYTADFELYPENFDPDAKPEVKIYIAIQ